MRKAKDVDEYDAPQPSQFDDAALPIGYETQRHEQEYRRATSEGQGASRPTA